MWLGSVQREFRALLGDLRDLLGREEDEGEEMGDEREGGMEKRGMEKKEGEVVEKEEMAGWERKRRRRSSFLWMTTTTTNLGVVQLRVGRDLVERWRVGSMEEVSVFSFSFSFSFSFFEEQRERGWTPS